MAPLHSSCAHLPNPQLQPATWDEFVRSTAWDRAAAEHHSSSSALDKVAPRIVDTARSVGVACNVCCTDDVCMSFATNKALMSHQRAMHGMKTRARFYAESDGVRQCCKTRFVTRLRAVRHLTDRRSTCLAKLVASAFPVLTDERVAELDDVDRIARRQAQIAGRAQPAAVGPAKTAVGRLTGRVTS